MNKKIIAIFALAVLAVVGIFFFMRRPATITGPPTVTTAEETILSDQINSLTDEQLAAISTDLTDFSTTTQSDIAGDYSQFMYQ